MTNPKRAPSKWFYRSHRVPLGYTRLCIIEALSEFKPIVVFAHWTILRDCRKCCFSTFRVRPPRCTKRDEKTPQPHRILTSPGVLERFPKGHFWARCSRVQRTNHRFSGVVQWSGGWSLTGRAQVRFPPSRWIKI